MNTEILEQTKNNLAMLDYPVLVEVAAQIDFALRIQNAIKKTDDEKKGAESK